MGIGVYPLPRAFIFELQILHKCMLMPSTRKSLSQEAHSTSQYGRDV